MYGYGFLLGITLAVIFWALVIYPGEVKFRKKRLEIIRKKLKRIKERKIAEAESSSAKDTDSES